MKQVDQLRRMAGQTRRMLPVAIAILVITWILFIVVLIAHGPAQPAG